MKNKITFKLLYLSLFIVVFCIELFLLENKSIIGDETGTLNYALNFSFSDLVNEKYVGDFNPFLYFVITKGFFLIIKTDWSLRLFSVFCYFISLFIYVQILTLLKYNQRFIFTSLAFYSLMPLLLQYSIFARGYSALLLISTLLVYFIIKEAANPSLKNRILYTIILTLGLYTHYFTGFFLFVFTISYVPFIWNYLNKKNAINFIFYNATALLLFLPELNNLLVKLSSISGVQQSISYQPYYKKLFFIIFTLFYGETSLPSLFSVLLSFVPFSIFFISIITRLRNPKIGFFKFGLFHYSIIFILISCIVISSTGFPRPMYIIFVLPFVSFSLTKIFYYIGGFLKYIFLAPILLIYSYSIINNIFNRTENFVSPQYGINYKTIIPIIEKQLNSNYLLIVSPSFNSSVFQLYSSSFNSKNYFFFNPFESAEIQINKINSLKQKKIILINEFHDSKAEDKLKLYLDRLNFNKTILFKREHNSFTRKESYTFFEVIQYN